MWFLEMMHADAMHTAAELLARRGYDNVQACELARALRFSVGTLYRHYGSKQGLALAVREYAERELSYRADVAFFMKHVRPGEDFPCAFRAFWEELVGWALRHADLFS
ncbi:helix-turn-helix domain-containing protein, partial [Pyxidicoccus sp. 3LFB2]